MNQNLSRRDFLKIAGVGLGALAFNPFKPLEAPPFMPQFPAGDRLGRVFSRIDVRSEPSFNAPSVGVLYDDQVVVWQQELVTRGAQDPNVIVQRWVKVPEGYIYSPHLQPVKNIPNTPLTALPEGQSGFWAEVTVPYADMRLDGPALSPHVKYLLANNIPLRLYYSQVVWIDQIAAADGGVIWYRFNENGGRPAGLTGGGYGDILWGEGAAFRPLTTEDVTPINPDVDPATKK